MTKLPLYYELRRNFSPLKLFAIPHSHSWPPTLYQQQLLGAWYADIFHTSFISLPFERQRQAHTNRLYLKVNNNLQIERHFYIGAIF